MNKLLQTPKTVSRKLLLSLSAFLFLSFSANAQFEEKLSVNVAIGGVVPVGTYDWYDAEYDEYNPYIFPNFYPGASFMGGVQYNFNRRFSVEGRLFTFYLWDWEYVYDIDGWYSNTTMQYWHLGLGIAPKFYIRPGKKINPYGFAELNLSFNDIYFEKAAGFDEYGNPFYAEESVIEIISGEIALGTYLGAGIDFNIISNLGLFAQGGYYITLLGSAIEENTGEWEHFNAIRGEIGVKLNLFKSKQL